MKKKEKKNKFKFFVFVLIVIPLCLTAIQKKEEEKDIGFVPKNNISIEKISKNNLYNATGQEKIEDQDGYDTTFTTINNKVYKEYKQNGNSSWKNNSYWGGTVEENGCALAALSTIMSGYNLKYTPEELRKIYVKFPGEHLEGDQISSELKNRFSLNNSDFQYADSYFKKKYLINHMKDDKPVLICVWNRPSSKWTTSSHYMVLLATDEQNKFYVSNPNGTYGKEKMSGWYDSEEILPYIAKALFFD